jgi:hypothetical protein
MTGNVPAAHMAKARAGLPATDATRPRAKPARAVPDSAWRMVRSVIMGEIMRAEEATIRAFRDRRAAAERCLPREITTYRRMV